MHVNTFQIKTFTIRLITLLFVSAFLTGCAHARGSTHLHRRLDEPTTILSEDGVVLAVISRQTR